MPYVTIFKGVSVFAEQVRDSHIATGAETAALMWNLVKLGDKWYYTDVTWDDQPYLDFYYEYFNLYRGTANGKRPRD